MRIFLYRNTSTPITVNKTLSDVATIDGTLRQPTNLINPVIQFEGSLANFQRANYAKIPDFNNRYYYIRNMTSVNNNMCEILLHCDVLMTYKTEFKQWTVFVARQESNYNLLLNDPLIQCNSNPIITRQNFPYGMRENSWVLVVAGP